MTTKLSLERIISKSELGIGVVLSLLIVYLHYLFIHHAGGLWRDETATFNIATHPSLISNLQLISHESFPGFFYLLLRIWHEMGFTSSDFEIRIFGSLIGLSLLAAFWITGRRLGYNIPLISCVLIGLSPLAIHTSDAIRGYGIGTTLIILTLGLVWQAVQKPSLKNIIFASVVAILSVHSLYQNAFLLLAICLGAFAVIVRHRLWTRTFVILSIGGMSALSLLLYAGIIQRMHGYKELIVVPTPISDRLIHSASAALSVGGKFMLLIWLALILAGILIAIYNQFQLSTSEQSTNQQDLQLFSVVTLVTSVIGFIFFLTIIDLPTHEWYYIPLMSLIAVLLDTIFVSLFKDTFWRTSRLFAIVVLSLCLFSQAISGAQLRHTNIDIIADKLSQLADKNDFIIVSPWYCGTTFSRYFHANIPWSTLPPLRDYSLQRLDLIKEQMQLADPIAPVIKQIYGALTSGNRVWIVGILPSLPTGQRLLELPPAPNSPWGWRNDVYTNIWEMQTRLYIQQHILEAQLIPIPINQDINQHENLPLTMVSGWKN